MDNLESLRQARSRYALRQAGLDINQPRYGDMQGHITQREREVFELPINSDIWTPLQDGDGVPFFVFGFSRWDSGMRYRYVLLPSFDGFFPGAVIGDPSSGALG